MPKLSDTDVETGTVIRAVYDLYGNTDRWPTIERVAEYLCATSEHVRKLLLELRRKRIFIDRQREGERVWMAWGNA